jgi:nicotinate-nucleotide adenylyltransferase
VLLSMEQIGLFGGSFNPVHLGHLLVAQAALDELQLSRLYFIPAAQSPFKPDMHLAPANERLRCLRLALVGKPRCEVDEQEVRRGGISYSIDTVRDYAKRFPNAQLWYLIGADHASLLPKWRAAEELAELACFAVIPRPGQLVEADWLPKPFRGRALRGWPINISASQIRDRVRDGAAIDWLVPAGVAEAIRNNRLYL